MQSVEVISYRRFGTTYIGPIFRGQESFEDVTNRLSRDVDKELPLLAA